MIFIIYVFLSQVAHIHCEWMSIYRWRNSPIVRAKSGLISPHKVIARMFSDLDGYDVVSGAHGGNGSTEGVRCHKTATKSTLSSYRDTSSQHRFSHLLPLHPESAAQFSPEPFAHLSQRTEGNHFWCILKPVFTTACLQQDKVFILFVVSFMVSFILLEARAYQYPLAWPWTHDSPPPST